ncbi:hypothetical protein DRO64_11005 [Candidatus Bathyarchaeota archaeon]|nr:MAG: hypothetical protein DRO64_11005 [Candidatus Bathyarchaeota archaeon]
MVILPPPGNVKQMAIPKAIVAAIAKTVISRNHRMATGAVLAIEIPISRIIKKMFKFTIIPKSSLLVRPLVMPTERYL